MNGKLVIKKALASSLHLVDVWRRLSFAINGNATVLTYHRVVEPESIEYPLQPGMYVRPETFRMQMQYLSKNAEIISLNEYLEALDQGKKFNRNTVVITFDDGWVDTYSCAFSFLKELKIPATVFLATAYIGTGDCFWSDDISRSVFALWKHPEMIKSVYSRLAEADIANLSHRQEIHAILGIRDINELREAIDGLVEKLKLCSAEERKGVRKLLKNLAKEFCVDAFKPQFLNWDQVLEMQEHRITFGSHSHQHLQFHELTAMQIKDEVSNSLQVLRARGVKPVSAFCYPGGYYSELSQQGLASEGIRYALTVQRSSDLSMSPKLIGRINIHQDISNNEAMFAARIWSAGIF